jgi:hypothetical protein
VWDPFFPKFGVEAKSKAEAIGRYWDHYHVEIQRLVKQYPDNVRRYETLELLGHKVCKPTPNDTAMNKLRIVTLR